MSEKFENFEKYLNELKEIVEQLESGNLSLDESITKYKKGIELSDIIICPETQKYNSLKIENVEELIEAGYMATKQMIQQIENLLMGKLKK